MTTIQEKIEVMQAWTNGQPIEFRHSHATDVVPWTRVKEGGEPSWAWDHFTFRAAAPKEPEPDVIPWNVIHGQYLFAFRDPHGKVFVTQRKPDLIDEASGGWGLRAPGVRIDTMILVNVGDLPWPKTLQERPA